MVAKLIEQQKMPNLSFISSLTETNTIEQEQTNALVGCVVSSNTRITGDFHAEGDMRLDGFIDGALRCDGRLVIGRNGQVDGKIVAKQAVVRGRVDGDIEVNEKLSLESTAFISGTITAKHFGVQSGATYNGTCKIG